MNKARLEAFSDGVFAIIITIMVLEIKIPHEASISAMLELVPVFISYVISFLVIAIYWVNHHHLLHTIKRVNSRMLWGNFALLFPLSLIPFSTGWIGENYNEQLPMTVYCINMFLCGFGAYILQMCITAKLPANDAVFVIIKRNMKKTVFSVVMYIISIACSFFYPAVCLILIGLVAIAWVIPDREIEKLLEKGE